MRKIILTSLLLLLFASSILRAEKIELNFDVGNTQRYEMTTTVDMEMMQGITTNIIILATYKNVIEEKNGDTYICKQIIEKMDLIMKVESEQFTLNASTLEPLDPNFKISQMQSPEDLNSFLNYIYKHLFGGMAGGSYQIIFNKQGEVLEVRGYKEFFENTIKQGLLKMVDALDEDLEPGFEDNLNNKFDEMMGQQFNEDMIKKSMEYYFLHISNKDVEIGDTWKKNITFEDMGEINTDVTLVNIENNTAKVEFTGDQNLDLSDIAGQQGSQIQMDVKINGTVIVELETGMPLKTKFFSLGSGQVTVDNEETSMRVSSKVEIKRID
jgi:Family of unknown function (DUF6263)